MKDILNDIKRLLEQLNELEDDYEVRSFEDKIEKKLEVIKYKETYDIDLKERDFNSLDNVFIDRFKGDIRIGYVKRIFNSDKQPKEQEKLFSFSYPTGPYIFGGGSFSSFDNYDIETFNEFFEELMKYGYKYIDGLNHKLYFEIEDGVRLFKDYPEICKKYQEIWDKRAIEKKKELLKKQLEEFDK